MAAAALAESQGAAKNRKLPATCAHWRSDARAYKRAVAAIRIIYKNKFKDEDGIAFDQRNPPKWLQAVVEAAHLVFPTSVQ